MLAPNEIEYLTQLQDNGTELTPEANTAIMQADEAELDIEFIGEDDE